MQISFYWKRCVGHTTAWNIFRSHIDHQTLWKNLKALAKILNMERLIDSTANFTPFFFCYYLQFKLYLLLKLVRTHINYQYPKPPYFFKTIILSMHLFRRMNVMLDFLCIGSVELRRTRSKRNYKIKLVHSGIRTHALHDLQIWDHHLIHIARYEFFSMIFKCTKYVYL